MLFHDGSHVNLAVKTWTRVGLRPTVVGTYECLFIERIRVIFAHATIHLDRPYVVKVKLSFMAESR